MFFLYCSQGQVDTPQQGTQQGLATGAQVRLWLITPPTHPQTSQSWRPQAASPSSGVSTALVAISVGHSSLGLSVFVSLATVVSRELLNGRDSPCLHPQHRGHGRASGNVLAKSQNETTQNKKSVFGRIKNLLTSRLV